LVDHLELGRFRLLHSGVLVFCSTNLDCFHQCTLMQPILVSFDPVVGNLF
jgi:hypothetical protein